jgi:Family of unknown function (DUF5677)
MIREFPDENERVHDLESNLARQFEFAERFYRFWLERPKDRWLSRSNLPENSLHLAMLLNIQACRQFRSMVEECRRGEAFCANIIARSLYETTLALLFVLKPRVRIVVEPDTKRRTHPDGSLKYSVRPLRKKEKASNIPSRELRADLYVAHSVISGPAFFERMGTIPKLKRFGKQRARRVRELTAPNAKEFQRRVGPEWWSALRITHSYSGLGVEQLTSVVDSAGALTGWYQTVYRAQCSLVHGNEALLHGQAGADGMMRAQWFSTDNEVCGALHEACLFLLVCVNTFQRYIGLGTGMASAQDGFFKECTRVFTSDGPSNA